MSGLTPECSDDELEVEALFDLCFGPGRTALSSYRLREGNLPVPGLSMVARDGDGILAGAVRYWPIMIGTAPSLLLGPIAVHPTRQGEGLGASLILQTATKASEYGWLRILLVGDEPYYGRFGFHRRTGLEMPRPTNPERVLGRELQHGSWEEVVGVVTPAPHIIPMSNSIASHG
ncbi:MAG: N-acetyltransferase [Pseudomonadota bacterium]